MIIASTAPLRELLAVFALLFGCVLSRAATSTPSTRDTLVYKDGDRIQGKLVQQTADTIVFKSDRFGELRVPAADAVIIKGEKPVQAAPPPAVAAAPAARPAASPESAAAAKKSAVAAEQEKATVWDRFSPSVLTARVRNVFGPWHGKISFSTEVVTDTAHRNTSAWETHVQRKWKTDEVQLNGRYDFSETNHLTTTDLVKAWGQWRHEFNQQLFTTYRPTVEWNRASFLRGRPNDYVMLQQEIGIGDNLFTRPTRKIRVGVSQNRFDIWNSAAITDGHTSRRVFSTFEEADITLPWRITISQRGVWYPVPSRTDGWENRIDLNKKLTETLSTGIRHEIRRHNPDGTAPDYERLKLLFGLDF